MPFSPAEGFRALLKPPVAPCAQGFETFEACFKTLALRDVLDGGSLARWLSPRRGGAERGEPGERWLPRQCGRVAIVCASIAGLMLVIAATQASTRARPPCLCGISCTVIMQYLDGMVESASVLLMRPRCAGAVRPRVQGLQCTSHTWAA